MESKNQNSLIICICIGEHDIWISIRYYECYGIYCLSFLIFKEK